MKLFDDIQAKFNQKSPAQRERLKKILVISILSLSCAVCIWLIFAPSSDDYNSIKGANTELPDQTAVGLPSTKIQAYEQEALQKEKEMQQSQLADLSQQLDSTAQETSRTATSDGIQSSASAYQQAQASLQNFYIPDYSQPSTVEVEALQSRIDELEAQASAAQLAAQAVTPPNEMELLEKSYQLAAQYMGNGNVASMQSTNQSKAVNEDKSGTRDVQPVQNVARKVVSTLSAATGNRGFNTSVGSGKSVNKNTIAAVVAVDQSISNGQGVKLRITEPMWVGSTQIPRNSIVFGEARVKGERLDIDITSIETNGSVYAVELMVYDTDGQPGINIPNSMESDALHEIGANMGTSMGSSISLTTDTKAQLASDVGKGLINGVSQYLGKKMRTVKVHLKAGYRVMLHQSEG